ncbi:MAG: heparan-alpha-glucosaminide N-acetyltransferase domain-containing protein [Gemmatimonadota bacterium]
MTAADMSSDVATATASVSSHRRIESIDIVRGVIMILMALDHTRDYFGNAAVNPTDPATTTAWLFFTRWVTHICAPGFFLLTGVGASLTLHRMSKGELSRFLFTRGVWLLVLEIVIVRCFGWQFNFDYRLLLLNVLWGLGFAMIFLSALVHLRDWAVTTIGVVMIASHNLFDGVQATAFGTFAPVWNILHAPGVILGTPRHTVFTAYALIPWVGVTAAGYGLGAVYRWEDERRNRFLLRLGLALVAGFLLLRTVNGYGDPSPWSQQASPLFSALSYINTTKYPPSLLFLLMTLGPIVLLLRALEGGTPAWLRPAHVFGKVPLFYYLLHVPLIHLTAVLVCFARYGDVHWMFQSNNLGQYPVTQPPGWPLGLPWVYLIWAGVVVTLYPLCRWFASVKRRRTDWWLGYL